MIYSGKIVAFKAMHSLMLLLVSAEEKSILENA